eukprot:734683-Pleurochrysis_carterae.AAC.1
MPVRRRAVALSPRQLAARQGAVAAPTACRTRFLAPAARPPQPAACRVARAQHGARAQYGARAQHSARLALALATRQRARADASLGPLVRAAARAPLRRPLCSPEQHHHSARGPQRGCGPQRRASRDSFGLQDNSFTAWQSDRYSIFGADGEANTYADTDANSDAESDANTDIDANAITDADADADTDTDTGVGADAGARRARAHAHTHADADADAEAYPDFEACAFHDDDAQTYANADAVAHAVNDGENATTEAVLSSASMSSDAHRSDAGNVFVQAHLLPLRTQR